MKRVEIIANQSVREELLTRLEESIPGLRYTLVPTAQGRGLEDRKLGTTVWPEQNFVWFSYLEDGQAAAVVSLVAEAKVLYPREGIRVFTITAD